MKPGIWEILLVVVLILILFGSAKIPGMMKNIANGINIFKKEVKSTDKKSEKADKKVVVVKKVAAKKSAKKTK
jgi:sec-independent protein translocase protein TatA